MNRRPNPPSTGRRRFKAASAKGVTETVSVRGQRRAPARRSLPSASPSGCGTGGVVAPAFRPLFGAPDAFCRAGLQALPEALDRIFPLNRAHRADLPSAVRDLSALLTTERGSLGRSYWSAPRFVSAYLRYFLPWNLVRLTRLLPGLELPDVLAADLGQRVLLDVGSGPLTLPLALWLSRPEWRTTELTVVCADTAPRPMELGRRLLETLAALLGEPFVWRLRLLRAALPSALGEARRVLLLTAGNVLNELPEREAPREERLSELALSVGRCLQPGGGALFVEPGTRLGGGLVAALREQAIIEGLEPVSPCPHAGACPLLGKRERGWCHVSADAGGPVWLAALSKAAHLSKDSLSLAYLQLRPGDPETSSRSGEGGGKTVPCRVISDAFPVRGLGAARYGCCSLGLALLPEAAELPSGSLVSCCRPASPVRDAKSGAVVLPWRPVLKTS